MTTTFQYVTDNVVEAKFTVREDNVILGALPKCFQHLLSPNSPRNLEYNLLRHVRSTANAENVFSKHFGLRVQLETEYPAYSGQPMPTGKHAVSPPPAPYMPPIGTNTN